MPWFSHVCFVLLLAAIGQILVASEKQDKAVSRYRNRSRFHDFSKKEFKSLWRCEVNESYLSNWLNTAFTEGNKLISLTFKISYPKKVDEKYVNQTLNKSIAGNVKLWNQSYWQMFLIDRKLPGSVNNVIRRFSFVIGTHVSLYFNVSCNFTVNSAINQHVLSDAFYPRVYLERILRSTAASFGELCTTEVDQTSQQPCIDVSEVNRVKDRWNNLIALGCFAFLALFVYIGPTVVCLFAATEDTHEGFRQITVEGPSPVGFRSLIGNYFFSSDRTLWHMARKFIMRVVILPLPFLVPAVFIEYLLYENVLSSQISVKERTHLFRPIKMACYACYCFQAFYFYFIIGKNNCTKSCVEKLDCDGRHPIIIWHCFHRELPQRMLTRVQIIRWISLRLWCSLHFEDFHVFQVAEIFRSSCPPCRVSISSFLDSLCHIIKYLPIFVLGLCMSFFQILGLCVYHSFAIIALPPFSILCASVGSSLWQVMDVNFLHRYILLPVRLVVVLLDILVSCLSAVGVVFVLQYAAVGVIVFLQLGISLVFSEQNLAECVCSVLVAFYLWRSYRSFTQKYQDLAAALFEKHHQLKNNGRERRLRKPEFTPDYGRAIDNVKRIPKELFDMACEELVPVRESVGTMVLEIVLSVLLVFLGFSVAIMLTVPPAIKALLVFGVGSIPKTVTILLDRRRPRNLKAELSDQNVREIFKRFFNTVPYIALRSQKAVSPADSCSQGHLDVTSIVNATITLCVGGGALLVSLFGCFVGRS